MKRKVSAWFVFIILLGGIGIIPVPALGGACGYHDFLHRRPQLPVGLCDH
ncbi:MAG: hypothetical protein MZV70_24225 [Desulfobacterales bacterium]|nr:hypothetical protein [Desulfobacterales bacterium]